MVVCLLGCGLQAGLQADTANAADARHANPLQVWACLRSPQVRGTPATPGQFSGGVERSSSQLCICLVGGVSPPCMAEQCSEAKSTTA